MNIKYVDKQFSEGFVVIHYGDTKWRPDMFGQVMNEDWRNKPAYGGGLWTSPVNSEHSWKRWCDSEDFRKCEEEKSFRLRFKAGAQLVVIDGVEDLYMLNKTYPKPPNKLLSEYHSLSSGPNFEKLAEDGYDAIWLTERGEIETRFGDPSLYGWDCETVLILNKSKIIEV